MTTQKYCESVDRKSLLQKKKVKTVRINENHSPLISLLGSGIDLRFEPSIQKGYKYLVREAVIEKIGRISEKLNKENKVLFIRSGWRSIQHQQLLWINFFVLLKKENPGKDRKEIEEMVANFIAVGEESMHSTGGAVDALIYDLKNNRMMDFGTNKGNKITLDKKCYPYYPDISAEAKKNRSLLIDLFENEDFVCDIREYWHFDYGNAIWALEKKEKYAIYGIIPS